MCVWLRHENAYYATTMTQPPSSCLVPSWPSLASHSRGHIYIAVYPLTHTCKYKYTAGSKQKKKYVYSVCRLLCCCAVYLGQQSADLLCFFSPPPLFFIMVVTFARYVVRASFSLIHLYNSFFFSIFILFFICVLIFKLWQQKKIERVTFFFLMQTRKRGGRIWIR